MSGRPSDHAERMRRVRVAIEGLSLGDSFGERFLHRQSWTTALQSRQLPPAPWKYTDDTEMALAIAEVLEEFGAVDQDHLAVAFTRRYGINPYRGYGSGAHEILSAIARGESWRDASNRAFDGQGSLGNGGAMRAAPIGAYFADESYETIAEQARLSAEVTHSHPEGIAGAVGIAIAAGWAARSNAIRRQPLPGELFSTVLAYVPPGQTKAGIERAARLNLDCWQHYAAEKLGNGGLVTSADTVPFALWVAARHIDDFTEALWTTVHVGGDIDTNCAIVGGIVALAVGPDGIPSGWLPLREPLVWRSDDD